MQEITPCLWFDTEGEAAAKFYTSVFPNSRIVGKQYYDEAGMREAGTVMMVEFELDGQKFVALNGGPEFKFNEAISLQIRCDVAGRGRPLLEQAHRGRRRGGPVRLAQGQVRRVVAGHPDRAFELLDRSRQGEGAARDGGDAEDEEDRRSTSSSAPPRSP